VKTDNLHKELLNKKMSIEFQQLIKDTNKIDLDDICSSWQWCLTDQKSIVFVSCVGDMFLVGNDNAINWLDTSIGQIIKVADNLEEFEQLLNDDANVDNWFLATLIEQLITNGKTLKENEVYSFKKLPALGGEYSVENLEIIDISVHFGLTGNIAEQIKDLPDGTKVNFKVAP
jgi:hypothetical protein